MRSITLVLLFIGAPVSASAQDVERARERYAEGLEALDDSRWAEALGAFGEAYELSRAPPALFNVAVVLRGLGRIREARDTLTQLLELLPEGDLALREIARTMRAEAAARVAVLTLEDLPAPPRAQLRLDGEPLADTGQRPLRVELDPGRHALAVTLEGHDPFEWRETLVDGARETVRVELEPSGGMGLWPWIAAGGALLAVAIVVTVLVVTSDPSTLTNVRHPRVALTR